MSGRGVLFAIDDEVLGRLGEASTDAAVLAIVSEIEERWESACELDKAWDAIHRALTDGKLSVDHGQPPLSHVVLGGTILVSNAEAIVSVKGVDEVISVAKALRSWDASRFRAAYHRIDRSEYGDLDEEDLTYSLAWFERLGPFYEAAARAERAVVFAVDL
ncbi:MAG: YfbM family protein [Sandaracinaceae bacterium]|nr:YfbM family protein [Sandaracinaceae bacterium]